MASHRFAGESQLTPSNLEAAIGRLAEVAEKLPRASMHGSAITVVHSGTGISWALAAVSIVITLIVGAMWWKLDDKVKILELQHQAHERRINGLEKADG